MVNSVEMKGIVKKFGTLVANNNVDFSTRKGEVHALVGENGAGKTTLMNILYGVIAPDEGSIQVDGREIHIGNPAVAIGLGIGMVHQHFKLVPSLSVAENIVLGSEPGSRGFLDRQAAVKQVAELADRFALTIDPTAPVQDLPVGLQQRVEILKMLYREAQILILDEPTAVLTPQETEELFRTIRNLTADGKTVIFITHKLNEVMKVSDRVSVMRAGRMVATLNTSEISAAQLAEKMVGRSVLFRVQKQPAAPKEILLEVKDLRVMSNRGLEAVRGVSLQVRAGEIVGLAGVQGNGQDELVEVLAGLRRPTAGDILLRGSSSRDFNPRQVREAGVAYIPSDRIKVGLSLDAAIWENMLLGYHNTREFNRGGLLDVSKATSFAQELISRFDIRGAQVGAPVKSLSGGNQQKVVLAREFSHGRRVIIADQPSRGVDIGAIEFIHKQLVSMRDQGCGVFLISADLDEIFSLSDRILVIFHGEIMGELAAQDATVEEVGRLMAGINRRGGDVIG